MWFNYLCPCLALFFPKLLSYLRKLSFTLQNQEIEFDQHGDPPASLAVVLWRPNQNPLFVVAATYESHPTIQFNLDSRTVPWSQNGTVSNLLIDWFTKHRCDYRQYSIFQMCIKSWVKVIMIFFLQVPYSNCSIQCDTGYKKVQTSIHKCCFQCEKCKAQTYVNTTGKKKIVSFKNG